MILQAVTTPTVTMSPSTRWIEQCSYWRREVRRPSPWGRSAGLVMLICPPDLPFGVPNGERKGCHFSQPLRVSTPALWRVLVFCVLIGVFVALPITNFFRTWDDRIVYGMDVIFERCCKICLICLVDLAVVDCWRAVIYTRKPGFVVHTIQGLRLAILSAYVHISHTSFSSHSPVNTTGKSKLVVYHPARPHNPRGLSSQSIISEGVSIHPSANCQQNIESKETLHFRLITESQQRLTGRNDNPWRLVAVERLLEAKVVDPIFFRQVFVYISGCAFLVQ